MNEADALRYVAEGLRQRLAEGDDLVHAFAEWLGVSGPLARLPASGLWYPREVATAGLVQAAGRPTPRPFAEGLASLMRCAYFDPNLPPGFEADPLAILGVAVGVHVSSNSAARSWLLGLMSTAIAGETDEWRVGLLQGARRILGQRSELGPLFAAALTVRGVGTASTPEIEDALRRAASVATCSPEEAAVRLAAIEAAAHLAVRPTIHATTASPEPRLDKVKILFLASNPMGSGSVPLDIHTEIRDIQAGLRAAEHRDAIEFVSEHAVTIDDLDTALMRHRPVVVHFSGHGAGAPGIVLHGATPGDERLVDADALADLFRILKDDVRVVVLNACYSDDQARAIAGVIDFVVGMTDEIGDEAARKFAAAFYRGLAFGRSVQECFDLGVNVLKREKLVDDINVPKLIPRLGANTAAVLVGEARPAVAPDPHAWIDEQSPRGDVRRYVLREALKANEQGGSGAQWSDPDLHGGGSPFPYRDIAREISWLQQKGLVRSQPTMGVLRASLTADGRDLVEARFGPAR